MVDESVQVFKKNADAVSCEIDWKALTVLVEGARERNNKKKVPETAQTIRLKRHGARAKLSPTGNVCSDDAPKRHAVWVAGEKEAKP